MRINGYKLQFFRIVFEIFGKVTAVGNVMDAKDLGGVFECADSVTEN